MRRFFRVVNVLGMVIALFALTMLLPLGVAIGLNDGVAYVYDEAIFITLTSGTLLWLMTRKFHRELRIRDGFLLVVLVWLVLSAFATLPFLLYLPDLKFIDAYFEAVSALTTTGATVLTDLDKLPPSMNIWRGELEWLGGMGLIVFAVAILPLLGVGGRQLYKAETPGPMKETKLTPRIAETAKGLWLVYSLITLLCFFAYKVAGMTWLDAAVHGFATMGLGGFSSHDTSFGYFNSPQIEAVSITFMLVAGMNFGTHFLVWRQKNLTPYKQDPEIRPFIVILLLSCLGIAFYLWWLGVYPDFLTSLRFASFNTVSIATNSGFVNTDYNQWPIFAPLLMLFLCCFIACSGSTGSGIKMIRAKLLCKQIFREMVKTLHPSAVTPVKLSGSLVPNTIIQAILVYLFVYVVCIVGIILALTASGLDLISSFSATIACINNTGPGLNQVGPATTYAVLTDFQTGMCIFAMLLGRLELFTLLIVFTPVFWRK